MEEGAPADAETKREAEVVKQVRDSDSTENRLTSTNLDLASVTAALSSPNLTTLDAEEPLEDDMMGDMSMAFPSSFKHQAIRNSKGKAFWDTFSESSSVGGSRTSPPPAPFLPRGSSSGISEDAGTDSPFTAGGTFSQQASLPNAIGPMPPTAAEITRRINNKRRRDDDFDPASFKRRAVSPGLSVHNSPIVQSPMQRDALPWGTASRPGSVGGAGAGEKGATSSAPSDSGSGTPATSGAGGKPGNAKGGRVGIQGMSDTNDGIMRMSIE